MIPALCTAHLKRWRSQPEKNHKKSPAGEVNPAARQLDFYLRSPEVDPRNNPTCKVFDHFFAMEVTWK